MNGTGGQAASEHAGTRPPPAVPFGRVIADRIIRHQNAWARVALLVTLGEVTLLDEHDTADDAIDVAAGVASLVAAIRSVRLRPARPASEDE